MTSWVRKMKVGGLPVISAPFPQPEKARMRGWEGRWRALLGLTDIVDDLTDTIEIDDL